MYQRAKVQRVEIAYSDERVINYINKFGNIFPEFFSDFFLGRRRIFNDIMENGSHQRLMIHMHFTQNTRNFQWVMDVWFSADALLPFMCFSTELIGLKYSIDLMWIEIRTYHIREITNLIHKMTSLSCEEKLGAVNLRQCMCRNYILYWNMKMYREKLY